MAKQPPAPPPLALNLSAPAAAAAFDALDARTIQGLAETLLHAGCMADLKAGCFDALAEKPVDGTAQLGNADRFQYLAATVAERMHEGYPGPLSQGYLELLGALRAAATQLQHAGQAKPAAAPTAWTFAPVN